MKEVLCSTTHSRNHEKIALKDDFFAHTLISFVLVNIAKMYQFAHPSWYENRVMPRKNTTIKCSFDFSSYPTMFGLKRHVLNCNLFGFVISLFFWVKYYVSLQKFLQLNKCLLLFSQEHGTNAIGLDIQDNHLIQNIRNIIFWPFAIWPEGNIFESTGFLAKKSCFHVFLTYTLRVTVAVVVGSR